MQQTKQHAYLIIQSGSRWTDILKLTPDSTVCIGRSSDSQVIVKDERVSRRHSRIFWNDSAWYAQDLGSRNGTQVNAVLIEGAHPLEEGDLIAVGGCEMRFVKSIASGFPHQPLTSPASAESQQTIEIDAQPMIVNRLENSRWSSGDLDAALGGSRSANPRSTDAGALTSDAQLEKWNFFYRLIFELVGESSPEAAAQLALDQLLKQLGVSSGGVVLFEENEDLDELETPKDPAKTKSNSSKRNTASAANPPVPPNMLVLATRQARGGSYRRVSDFLVSSVIQDRQAVLARNVQDDTELSLAQASASSNAVSIICAPLRAAPQPSIRRGKSKHKSPSHSPRVIGLLHVYSTSDEPMLSGGDLDLAVGVADNLAIALSRLQTNNKLAQDLDATRRKVNQLEAELELTRELVGESQSLQKVKQSIGRAGPTRATVLIRGESGVGKELVARAIHMSSRRAEGPLVCLNCAALAPTLLESELFGHEKGAFTGATERKIGKFEAANGGTLLLDEIGEMIPELQAKFLRVLEGQPFERLGGNQPIKTDVRVLAATNRNLEEAVEAKEFRSDLYYRLRVVEIEIPPLRERTEDIPLLVEHFLKLLGHHADRRIEGIDPKAIDLLSRHSWPGNVRELRNVLERAIVLGGDSTIRCEDLSLAPFADTPSPSPANNQENTAFEPIPLAELEKRHILAMLDFSDGNKTKAAQRLGIERSTLDRKLKRF